MSIAEDYEVGRYEYTLLGDTHQVGNIQEGKEGHDP
jgi:hypothetical protein